MIGAEWKVPGAEPVQAGPHTPLSPSALSTQHSALSARQDSFSTVISRARTRLDDAAAAPEEKARTAAEQLVAITFVQPVLKIARQSQGGSAPFAPTEAERRMGALMDAQVAQQLVHAAHFPIVERVARQLLEKHNGALPPEAARRAPDPISTPRGIPLTPTTGARS
jgi:Rod binding domain-containing protein